MFLAHPLDESFGRRHGGQPALAHQRPVVEQSRLLDFPQSDGWIEASQKLEVDYSEFGVLRIRTRRGDHLRQSHNRRVAHAVVDKNLVPRPHLPDGPQRLRIADSVPNRLPVLFQMFNRVGFRVCFCQEIIHAKRFPCRVGSSCHCTRLIVQFKGLFLILHTHPYREGYGLRWRMCCTIDPMSRSRAAVRVIFLCVLGVSILSAAAKKEKKGAKPAAPEAAVAATLDPKSFVIGPEDILMIRVWRDAEMSGLAMVRPDGKITLQLLGDIQAAGLTPEALTQQIFEGISKLKKTIDKSEVT